MSTDSAPYRIKVIPAGGGTDTHAALIGALGGDSVVAAFYVTTTGAGAASPSVILTGAVVDEWWDHRGETGFGPKLVGTGTGRPAWDAANKLITSDGADDNLTSALSSVFDLDAGKTLVVIGSLTTAYAGAIAESNLTTRFFALREQTGTIRGAGISGAPPDSGIASGATRRVMISTLTAAGTTLGIEVPDDAKVTAAATDCGAGNNALTLFSYWPGNGPGIASVRAVIVLNREATAPDVALLKTYGVNEHAAVLA